MRKACYLPNPRTKDNTPLTKQDAVQWKREVRANFRKHSQKGSAELSWIVTILCLMVGVVIGGNLLRLAQKGYDQERRERVSDIQHRPDFRNYDTSSQGPDYRPQSQRFIGCTVCGDQDGTCECGGYSVR